MKKKIIDALILLAACLAGYFVYDQVESGNYQQLLLIVLGGIAIVSFADMIFVKGERYLEKPRNKREPGITELVLLNVDGHAIKSWLLSGKTSLLIGKENNLENVDVDLEECEYSALVDSLHATLNYCLDHWYVEDLHSKNGVRVQMAKDGVCYKVSKNRPCKLSAGDVILIANTKLLIT